MKSVKYNLTKDRRINMGAYNKFKKHLDSAEINYVEDVVGNSKVFRAKQLVQGNNLLEIIFAFNEDETVMNTYVFNIAEISDSSKHQELYKLLNTINKTRNFIKLYAQEDGSVEAEYSIKIDENYNWNNAMLPVMLLIHDMENGDLLKSLMRLQWS